MNITWLGQSCFKIEDKVDGFPVVIITDPYDKQIGFRVPKMKADILTISHDHSGHNNVTAVEGIDQTDPIVFDRPGEYETKGVFIKGFGSYHDNKEGEERGKSTMFRFNINGIRLLHLGDLGTVLSDNQLSRLENVDILFIPVGGKDTIDAKEAAAVVRQIEPRIVIPMHYKIPGLKADIEGVDGFKKEMGNGAEELTKFKIAAKDLPQDAIKLIILNKS